MKRLAIFVGLSLATGLGWAGNSAEAEASIFELRITNNTDRALTFKLHEGQSKHARLVHNGNKVSAYTIASGAYDVVGVQATGSKCTPNCGGCSPTVGKVYAYYKDDKGNEQRNNYYEPSVEFFEYCGIAGTKPITTYTSNWAFDHGTGKGTANNPSCGSQGKMYYVSKYICYRRIIWGMSPMW